jgi:hypothetical protein
MNPQRFLTAAVIALLTAVGADAQQPGLRPVPRTPPPPPIRVVPTISPAVYPWPAGVYPPVYHSPAYWPLATPSYRCWGGVWTPVYCAYTSPFAAPPNYLPWYTPWPHPVFGW